MSGVWEVAGTLAFVGLAGSLHCVGMCGPILLAFSTAFDRREAPAAADPLLPVTSGGRTTRGARAQALDFAAYHAGRIWTYGLLGFLAGRLGATLRTYATAFGWQRPAALVIGGAVVLGGLLLLGLVPPLSRRLATACSVRGFGAWGWFHALTATPRTGARVLLGAVMGLLPCGMVWAMLPVVATLPTPLHAALGMLAFGLGTVPSLSAVLLAGRLWPARLRRHGTRLVGATLVLAGLFMLARAALVAPPQRGVEPVCRVSVRVP